MFFTPLSYSRIIMRAILFLAFSSFGTVMAASAYGSEEEKFILYYSDQAPIESFKSYQLLIFDRLRHPQLQFLREQGKSMLGYINIGEIEESDPYFSMLKNKGLVLRENRNRKDNYYIDIRTPLWPKILIEDIIPKVLEEGFDGIFLDNLDNYAGLEHSNPSRYKGMHLAVAHLIMAIRMHYPFLKIMVNHAYTVLPDIAPYIDMTMGEALLGDYDFDKKAYVRTATSLYSTKAIQLKEVQRRNPTLKIYTLDYADTGNASAVADIYRIQRANGFIPYVASIGLDEVAEEPQRVRKGIFQ